MTWWKYNSESILVAIKEMISLLAHKHSAVMSTRTLKRWCKKLHLVNLMQESENLFYHKATHDSPTHLHKADELVLYRGRFVLKQL